MTVPVPVFAAGLESVLAIRPLLPGDTATVLRIFEGMSRTSRYLRFHTGTPALSAAALRALTDMRPGRHVAFVGELRGRPVGLVRWIRLTDACRPGGDCEGRRVGGPFAGGAVAEVAGEVVDDVQHRGVGRALFAAALASAHACGIEEFRFDIVAENPIRATLLRVGAREGGGDAELCLPTSGPAARRLARSHGADEGRRSRP